MARHTSRIASTGGGGPSANHKIAFAGVVLLLTTVGLLLLATTGIYPNVHIRGVCIRSHPEAIVASQYQPRVPEDTRDVFRALLTDTAEILEEAGVPYWMNAGTMIGAIRHHGLIPWDDDIDINIADSHKAEFEALAPAFAARGYKVVKAIRKFWKIFPDDVKTIGRWPWGWPCIDVFPYVKKNAREITVIGPCRYNCSSTFEIADIFPTIPRLYENTTVLAPRTTTAFLRRRYGEDPMEMCRSPYRDHSREREIRPFIARTCDKLHGYMPFTSVVEYRTLKEFEVKKLVHASLDVILSALEIRTVVHGTDRYGILPETEPGTNHSVATLAYTHDDVEITFHLEQLDGCRWHHIQTVMNTDITPVAPAANVTAAYAACRMVSRYRWASQSTGLEYALWCLPVHAPEMTGMVRVAEDGWGPMVHHEFDAHS